MKHLIAKFEGVPTEFCSASNILLAHYMWAKAEEGSADYTARIRCMWYTVLVHAASQAGVGAIFNTRVETAAPAALRTEGSVLCSDLPEDGLQNMQQVDVLHDRSKLNKGSRILYIVEGDDGVTLLPAIVNKRRAAKLTSISLQPTFIGQRDMEIPLDIMEVATMYVANPHVLTLLQK